MNSFGKIYKSIFLLYLLLYFCKYLFNIFYLFKQKIISLLVLIVITNFVDRINYIIGYEHNCIICQDCLRMLQKWIFLVKDNDFSWQECSQCSSSWEGRLGLGLLRDWSLSPVPQEPKSHFPPRAALQASKSAAPVSQRSRA